MKTLLLTILVALPAQAQLGYRQAYDNEVQFWRASVAGVPATITNSSYMAATRLMLGLKRADIRRYIGRCGIYAGDTLGALNVPFIRGFTNKQTLGTLTDDLATFGAEDYAADGLKAISANEAIKTGSTPIELMFNTNSAHFSVYFTTTNRPTSGSIGCGTGAGIWLGLFLPAYSDGNCYLYFCTSVNVLTLTDPNPTSGFYCATRTGQARRDVWKNGVTLGSSTTDLGTTQMDIGRPWAIHATVAATLPSLPTSTNRFAYYSAGKGIPNSYQTNHYRIVQRFQNDMQRAK